MPAGSPTHPAQSRLKESPAGCDVAGLTVELAVTIEQGASASRSAAVAWRISITAALLGHNPSAGQSADDIKASTEARRAACPSRLATPGTLQNGLCGQDRSLETELAGHLATEPATHHSTRGGGRGDEANSAEQGLGVPDPLGAPSPSSVSRSERRCRRRLHICTRTHGRAKFGPGPLATTRTTYPEIGRPHWNPYHALTSIPTSCARWRYCAGLRKRAGAGDCGDPVRAGAAAAGVAAVGRRGGSCWRSMSRR